MLCAPLLGSCVDLMQADHHWAAPRERELSMLKTEISHPLGLGLLGKISLFAACAVFMFCTQVRAQEQLPWKDEPRRGNYDVYREVPQADARGSASSQDRLPNYVAPDSQYQDKSYGSGSAYNRGGTSGTYSDYDAPARRDPPPAERNYDRADYDRGPPLEERYERYEDGAPPPGEPYEEPGTFSQSEIMRTGHGFFGSVSTGLAQVIEKAFREQGQPNGYILGEDAGGAFIAGLRYGEGRLYTRDAGTYKVYWQGPTLGYDFGAEGSKTMVLIYNLRDPSQIYQRYGGVQGSAYLVGGVGLQLMQRDDVTLAPIRSGVGLRLGANVGYLKYTRTPTWNPF
jgi:hypothetical protein